MPAPAAQSEGQTSRRPIASRSSPWARAISARLAASAITPNQISLLSVVFAAAGGLLMLLATPLASILAAGCVQLRLLCNLFDGMVAVEGGKSSPTGALYNEFPDRIADTLFLVPAGYAAGLPWLGWAAALAAALTAYVRVFGGSLGLAQDFGGVMAKQRRMAALTVALVVQSIEWLFRDGTLSLSVGLGIIAVGSVVTCATRTAAIGRALGRP
jgi:phosphatidylglycerophosphate synthase